MSIPYYAQALLEACELNHIKKQTANTANIAIN